MRRPSRPRLLAALLCAASPCAYAAPNAATAQAPDRAPSVRVIDLKAADGTLLKGSYYAAAGPGPGVLLLHQVNRSRQSWDVLAARLAAAGINTLTLDMRGHGESGGTPYAKLTAAQVSKQWRGWPDDLEVAVRYLASQPGVTRGVIGLGGAGVLGVDNAVEVARRHPDMVKSLVLISGETFRDGLQFLHQASQLPGLFVVADNDEYPPTVEAMELLYVTSSSPAKKLVRYSASKDAPWLWYEPVDIGKVPATGSHGTDLFATHPELPGIIVDWFVTTLIATPGHAVADTLACAAVLDEIRRPGGVERVTQQLSEARRSDPKAQLFPEVTVNIIGADHLRAGEPKRALEVFQLNVLAYADSADANESLAEAYLADGQADLARRYAAKSLALLDSHTTPASSWADTDEYRGEIRHGAEGVLKKTGAVN